MGQRQERPGECDQELGNTGAPEAGKSNGQTLPQSPRRNQPCGTMMLFPEGSLWALDLRVTENRLCCRKPQSVW